MRIANIIPTTSIKERFARISSDPFPSARLIGLLLAGIAVGLIAGADQYLATFVPEDIWSLIFLYEFPYKVLLITAIFLCIGSVLIAWAARANEFREIQIVALVSSMQLIGIGIGGVDPIEVLTIAFMALIIAYALVNPSNPVKFPLIMYFALAIGILDLPYLATDRPAHFIIAFLQYSKNAILPLILVHILTSERLVRVFVKTLIAVASISACIGILQVIIFSYSGIPLVIVDELNEALKPTPWGMMLRAHGINSETHMLMSFLLIALPFSLYSATRGSSTRHTILYLIVSGIMVMAGFLTWSYGGIVGLLVILGLFPLFRWPNKSIHYILALLMIPVLLYATDSIREIYNALEGEASMSTGIFQRKMVALIAFDEISRNPWIGRGFGTAVSFSGNYTDLTVHNAYLEAWASIGFIGLIVFTSMMLIFTTSTFILGFSGSGEREYQLRMVTLTLIAFMILMIAEPKLYSTETWFLLGFAQALILLYGLKGDNYHSTDSTLAIVGGARRR